jgi:hypothetical protein
MATNTYVALDTKTLTSAAASVVFNSIPQTYTDLVLVSNSKNASGADGGLTLRFNTDTSTSGTNYSSTFLYGDGSSAASNRHTGYPHVVVNRSNSTNMSNGIAHIMNYTNTTTYKTIVSQGNSDSYVIAYACLWRATPQAITTITIGNEANVNFIVGSTFTLYGIASSNIGAPKAFGGTITQDATYTYHTFGASGTFTPQQSLTADCLVLAGGGGGGNAGGGGGAGSLIYRTGFSLTATGYSITVGTGGAGDTTRTGAPAASGTASTFNGISATGGGGGASNNGNIAGGAGGSGGGAVNTGAAGTASAGTLNGGTGYVFAGGGGVSGGSMGQGGGGAGAVGGTQNPPVGGLGGNGSSLFSSWLSATGTGVDGYIAGGGAGYSDLTNAGGLGGGGNSGAGSNNGSNGVVNTGSGGGGSRNASGGNGGNGGSGVVIIRYLTA